MHIGTVVEADKGKDTPEEVDLCRDQFEEVGYNRGEEDPDMARFALDRIGYSIEANIARETDYSDLGDIEGTEFGTEILALEQAFLADIVLLEEIDFDTEIPVLEGTDTLVPADTDLPDNIDCSALVQIDSRVYCFGFEWSDLTFYPRIFQQHSRLYLESY